MDSNANPVQNLDETISSQLEQRTGVISELKRCNQKGRELREELRRYAQNIRQERTLIREYYAQAEQSRNLRSITLAKIREINGKVKKTKEVLASFDKVSLRVPGELLRKKLEAFEWKLQAERLTREEEKQLVQHIKELEGKLRLWKGAYSARTELSKLLGEAQELKDNLDELHEVQENLHPQLEEKSRHLAVLLKARDQLQDETGALASDIQELEETLRGLDTDLAALEEKRSQMIVDQRTSSRLEQRKRQIEAIKQIREKVQGKLSRGEKVTFDQLKLVFSEESESLK